MPYADKNKELISFCAPDPFKMLVTKLETNLLEAIQLTGYNEGKEKTAEVELLVRRGDSHFYIKTSHGGRDTFLWDSARLPPKTELPLFTHQDEERELNRSIATIKKDYLPSMLASLKEVTTISIQATFKFKNGLFHWATLKYDKIYSN